MNHSGLLYYLGNTSVDIKSYPDRFRIMQKLYRAIKKNKYEGLFYDISRQMIGDIDDNDILLECMGYLNKCQIVDGDIDVTPMTSSIARRIARSVVEKIWSNSNEDFVRTHSFVFRFLRNLSENDNNMYDTIHDRLGSEKFYRNPFFKNSFFKWVLCEFCRLLVLHKKWSAYKLFVSSGWYSSKNRYIKSDILEQMRIQANLALGSGYCSNHWDEKDREGYREEVSRLVNSSSGSERMRGFFLIRQTGDTYNSSSNYSKLDTLVDPLFKALLKKIFLEHEDAELIQIVDRFRKMFERNFGSEFNDLQKRRKELLQR